MCECLCQCAAKTQITGLIMERTIRLAKKMKGCCWLYKGHITCHSQSSHTRTYIQKLTLEKCIRWRAIKYNTNECKKAKQGQVEASPRSLDRWLLETSQPKKKSSAVLMEVTMNKTQIFPTFSQNNTKAQTYFRHNWFWVFAFINITQTASEGRRCN